MATDQILNYIQKLEEIKDDIMIQNEGLELKRLAEENGLDYKDSDEQMVNDFLKLFRKESGIE